MLRHLLILSSLLGVAPLTHAEESCRPAMAVAVERAQARCQVFGCKTHVSRTVAIIAEHPEYTAGEILAEIKAMPFRSRIDIDAAVTLLTELGMIEAKGQ